MKPDPSLSQMKAVNEDGSWLLGEGAVTPEAAADFDFRKSNRNDQPSISCPSSKNFSGTHSRLSDYERLLSSEDAYNILKQVSVQ